MQRFNCLDRSASLQGAHLLEASAGTGKTFAVEQIFVRLLLEMSLEIEEILIITFTRAATRELKERIRKNIEKAAKQLQEDLIEWDYLLPFRGQKRALQKLRDSLGAFDRNQIFTIHGFCHRMLKEFSFEAKRSFSQKTDEPTPQIPEKLKKGVLDFLWTLPEELICPEQLALLCKKLSSPQKLAEKLLYSSMKAFEPGRSFVHFYEVYLDLMKNWSLSSSQMQSDFSQIAKNYKVQVKGQFEKQIEALCAPPTKEAFQFLLAQEGSLFEFLSPANRKVKYTPIAVQSDSFFTWGQIHLLPLIQEATERKNLFNLVAYEWSECVKKLMSGEEASDPDAILQTMHEALEKKEPFLRQIQTKYKAAVIDEFQDTDLLQWDIFRKLFLEKKSQALSVFLVGDPKQSIYRFRKADIYTYLQARDYLDPSCHYHLSTNYRSSSSLIDSLNTFFEKPWLNLPKSKTFLPYHPVLAGAKEGEKFADAKGALHFFLSPPVSTALTEERFFSFIAQEIFKLKTQTSSLSSFAVLVKDRYQASRVVSFLQKRGISALTKSHLPLGETFAFQALYELLDALIDPKTKGKMKLVLAGPFARMQLEEIPTEIPEPFFILKTLLEEKGLKHFFQRLFSSVLHKVSVLEGIALQDADFVRDFFHAVELLLHWEQEEGFSLQGLKRVLKNILLQEIEDDGRLRRRPGSDDEAVQVMTMHVSKGLEFDVVFALGLAASTPKPEDEIEELEAEKLRQLYVAMTRAKRRLYVPAILEEASPEEDGTSSPIHLFLHRLCEGKHLEKVLQEMAQKTNVTWDILSETPHLDFSSPQKTESEFFPLSFSPLSIKPSYLHSFTSLAFAQRIENGPLEEGYTIHTLPRGAEAGILLHEILEDIFSSSYPVWKKPEDVLRLVEQKIKPTKFAPWLISLQDLMLEVTKLPFLANLVPEDLQVEMEFIFEKEPHFIKGFIDLIFRKGDQLYLLDWKSNWLGTKDEDYSYENIQQTMRANDYELQAAIYAGALKRAFPTLQFSGAYYVFLRGLHSLTQGVLFFEPRKDYGRSA